MDKPIDITSLKPKTTILKKVLIIATATAGLLIAGALVVAAVAPSDEEAVEEASE